MRQAIDAIYENGAFKPFHPEQIHLPNGQRVTLLVDDNPLPEPLRFAVSVYEGLSESEIDEIESIALDRSHFFNQMKVER